MFQYRILEETTHYMTGEMLVNLGDTFSERVLCSVCFGDKFNEVGKVESVGYFCDYCSVRVHFDCTVTVLVKNTRGDRIVWALCPGCARGD